MKYETTAPRQTKIIFEIPFLSFLPSLHFFLFVLICYFNFLDKQVVSSYPQIGNKQFTIKKRLYFLDKPVPFSQIHPAEKQFTIQKILAKKMPYL